jgi:outer membrane protein assembly factor BamB
MTTRSLSFAPSLILASLALACVTSASDWPHWRGPDRNGKSTESNWDASLGGGSPKVLWSAEVGIGFSSFVTADGRVFTTGNTDDEDTLFCFEASSGKVLWKHSYPADLGAKFFEGGTTATPTLSGGQVFQLSRWGDVFCLDAESGKVVWSTDVQESTDARVPDWGFSGAPLVWGDRLILNVGQSGAALDKTNGKILWKSDSKTAGYSTPLPYTFDGKDAVLLGSSRAYLAVEVGSGDLLWEFPWRTSYGVNAADPIVEGELVYISAGYNKGAALLKPVHSEPEVVWQNREMRNQMNPPVLVDGHLYGVDGNDGKAVFKCLEFSTGKTLWEDAEIGSGSVLLAGGKLVILSESGELVVANPSPSKFDVISRAKILSGRCWTVPVLSNGLLFARNAEGKLVCVDLRK